MLILQQAARLQGVKTEGLVKNSAKMHSHYCTFIFIAASAFSIQCISYTISSSKLEEIASSIFTFPRSVFKVKASKVLLVDEFFTIQVLQHLFPA